MFNFYKTYKQDIDPMAKLLVFFIVVIIYISIFNNHNCNSEEDCDQERYDRSEYSQYN
jgi:hypothetical protein